MSMTLLLGDCLDIMSALPDQSVDLVLCDLPYGTTQCKWDSVIPFAPLWEQYRRLCKPNAPIVLTAAQPFTSALIASNFSQYKHNWVWEKTQATGHLNAKRQPMRAHEDIVVFCHAAPTYFPQKTTGHPLKCATAAHKHATRNGSGQTPCYGRSDKYVDYASTERYPRSVITFPSDKQRVALHPTQKPLALFAYLVRTYSAPEGVVLDNCMGSGTTGMACQQTGRHFVGIERDPHYFEIARTRLSSP